MLQKNIILIVIAASFPIILIIAGCETDAKSNSLIGAGIGAGLGNLIGGNTEGTLIGAAVGGGAGYVVGNESDKKKAKQQVNTAGVNQDNVTVWITNSNGSKTPVTLRKSGPSFIGPRNEVYQTMPTEAELKMVYGF